MGLREKPRVLHVASGLGANHVGSSDDLHQQPGPVLLRLTDLPWKFTAARVSPDFCGPLFEATESTLPMAPYTGLFFYAGFTNTEALRALHSPPDTQPRR